jgi:hypothetical protein
MNKETLEKANKLNRRITEFDQALNCFEWSPDEDTAPISTNPQIIIEYDLDGREQVKLPMILSDELVKILKIAIIEGKTAAEKEFEML